jgi:hypothetical protein
MSQSGHFLIIDAPHSAQNLPLGVFTPHDGHIISLSDTICCPHSRQNLAFGGSAFPHLTQFIVPAVRVFCG